MTGFGNNVVEIIQDLPTGGIGKDAEFKRISRLKLNRIKILKTEILESGDAKKAEEMGKRSTIINESRHVSVDEMLINELKKEAKMSLKKDSPFEYINEEVTIFEHAGEIFRELRKLDKISSDDIIKSLKPKNNLKKMKDAGESKGKSGSFFFFS